MSNKPKEVFISKASAYIYLKTLFTKSKLFENVINEIRTKYKIDFKEPIQRKNESKKAYFKRLADYTNDVIFDDVFKDNLFENLCNNFFIPKFLHKKICKYITKNQYRKMIGNDISVTAFSPLDNFSPYIHIKVPYDISQEDFNTLCWKSLQNTKKQIEDFLSKGHLWQDEQSFDQALKAYQLKLKGVKGKQLYAELEKAGVIATKSQFADGRKDVYKWINLIEAQVKSLEYFKEMEKGGFK